MQTDPKSRTCICQPCGVSAYLHDVHAVGIDMPPTAGVRIEAEADRLHYASVGNIVTGFKLPQ